MDWQNIWNSIVNFFNNNFWNIVKFVAIFILGIILVKITLNICKKIMSKTKMEKVTQGFLYHILKFCLYLIFILVLLSTIGISMTGVITALSAAVLAIGMALQNIITNIANGIVIVSMHMFKKGDFVNICGDEGSIEDINFLFTTIVTTDNKKITIPNSAVINNNVINYGANPTRRVDFAFEVAYESDVELVKKVVLDVIESNGKVRLDIKPPFCRLKTLEASSIKFVANCWCDSEDYWDVYYYVIENVFNEFKKHNISIPYNQLEIRERKDEVTMPVINTKLERVEKVRETKKKGIDLENVNLLSVFSRKHNKTNADNKQETKRDKKKAKKENE